MKDQRLTAQSSPGNDPSEQQRLASDPSVSTWVGASAGSGKTKVLTDRILRLLLPRETGEPGTRPERVLALTFTKAGANEMVSRLSKRLSAWAIMDDAALSKDIQDNLLGRTPSEQELKEARKLFARVVDTPGGLNIMTIHSFCQSILGRFPIEAGLPPGFVALDDSEARVWLAQARSNILSHAHTSVGTPLANAVERLAQVMNEEQIDQFLSSLNGERHQAQRQMDLHFGIDGLYANLCVHLGIDQGRDITALSSDFFNSSATFNVDDLCAALAGSKNENEQGKANIIRSYFHAAPNERLTFYPSYREIFLTQKGTMQKRLLVKATADAYPTLLSGMEAEAERLQDFENKRKSYVCASFTRDAFLFGMEVLHEYQRLKDERGALDFEDLILKTLALLKGETFGGAGDNVMPWILFKLDEGLEHILVDEAQDTNPEQWEIVKLLSREFFTGEGAHDTVRTVFVVGDDKQSIYSFQRAAPDKFRDMFNWFDEVIREAGQRFLSVPINTSFRSVQLVLDSVDAVFTDPQTRAALTSSYLNHFAHRTGQAGTIEIWPLLTDQGTDEETETNAQQSLVWDIPVQPLVSHSGAAQMAQKIAGRIRMWLKDKTVLEAYDRPIEPQDILILVKSRSQFVPQLVRALKQNDIPVSGIDRMVLSQQLVVEDLCAGASFALLPDDDLTLAAFLKSPLIGYDEDRLYELAQGRKEETLWDRVRLSGDGIVVSWLTNLIERAGEDRPYELFSRLVQEPCPADSQSGFHAIKKRLGEDAIDPLDEFLNLALAYEQKHTPTLQGFLKWHEDGESEIKRQMEEGGGAVRIMTVHGAKGLQAPIVFLPDTVRTRPPKGDRILWPHKTGLNLPVLYSSKGEAPKELDSAFATIRNQEDDEYRRLLYVAMTRAEERLYIGGYAKKAPKEDSETAYWYRDIRSAIENIKNVQRVETPEFDAPILRLETKRTAEKPDKAKIVKAKEAEVIDLPSYFLEPAPEEQFPPQPLAPSRPSEEEPPARSPLAAGDQYRFRRGTVTHRLLQTLPELPAARRRSAAQDFVARAAFGLPPETQASIVDETMAILEDPVFASIFGPGSMAEIPVTGYLSEGTIISGQIDRMLVTDDEILIVDYKTNRPPPQNEADIQGVYRRQMAAYAKAIAKIYPAKRIRTALLWTDGPRLMEIKS